MGNMKKYYVYAYFRADGSPCYIGIGSGKRFLKHSYEAKSGRHHNPHFARILNAANGDLPRAKIRDGLSWEQATATEIALIAAIGREANGGPLVNLTDGGEGCPGHSVSETVRENLRKAHLGRKASEETREKLKAGWTDEKRAAKSAASKAQWNKDGYRESASRRLTGRKLTEEHRLKISAGNIGKGRPKGSRQSIETREKMSASRKGRKISEETRIRMRAAAQIRISNNCNGCANRSAK